VCFFSFYKLSESPQTWTDEGLIVQTAQNLVGQGIYGFQIAPGQVLSPSFISTSYPVTFPIAVSFYIGGIGLYQARVVMALYIIALLALIWLYIRRENPYWALATTAILATFPPIYGQGKNVLGEVPGLVFLLLSAYFLRKIEDGNWTWKNIILFGIFSGICVATKPIFILLLPGFVLISYFLFVRKEFKFKKLLLLGFSFVLPIFAWVHFQFQSSDSISSVLGYYSNPHSLNILETVRFNVVDFLQHGHTLFSGTLFLLWSFVFLKSAWKKETSLSEVFLYIFSVFIFANYFRNPPYYRYFFVAEILCLMFFVRNINIILKDLKHKRYIILLLLSALITSQLYSMVSGSWVASAYNSHRTAIMQNAIGSLSSRVPVFVYQSPEAVVFLKHFNYYQYFSGTKTTEFGAIDLQKLKNGDDLQVLTKPDFVSQFPELFNKYHEVSRFDRYVLLYR
jgi:hypothetical protein